MQIKVSSAGGNLGATLTFSPSILSEVDTLEWNFPQENISSKKSAQQSFSKIFKVSGENPVLVK